MLRGAQTSSQCPLCISREDAENEVDTVQAGVSIMLKFFTLMLMFNAQLMVSLLYMFKRHHYHAPLCLHKEDNIFLFFPNSSLTLSLP